MFRADKRRIKGCLQTKRYDRTGRKQYVRPIGGGIREMCERGFINYVVQEKKCYEYANFVEDTIQLVIQQFVEKKLM